MNKHPEYKLVQKCLLIIEEQLGWGEATSWHNDVFIELSEKIQHKTQVLLSPTTLKRIWGHVNYNNAPSISTLNTLAQFAGFLNWRDFKNKTNIRKPSWFERKITPNLGIITASAVVMTILFLSLYSMTGTTVVEPVDYSLLKFKSRPISSGLPNSVVFDFDISEVQSDSIYIQQFWDPTKTIKVEKDQKQATGQYYYPGYFRAKLVIDGEIAKEHDLFIKSDGWLGTIDYEPIPKYIYAKNIVSDKLSYSNDILNEIKLSDKPLISSYHYIDELPPISGDAFELKTAIKNIYRDKWAVCQKIFIVIVGTKSAFIVPFSIPGCTSEIGVMLSDIYMSGKEHDLSSLGFTFEDFKEIRINTENHKLNVFLEDELLFSEKYGKSIGDVVGLRFRFLGVGELRYVKLNNRTLIFKSGV